MTKHEIRRQSPRKPTLATEQPFPNRPGHAIHELVALGLTEETSLGILRVLLRRDVRHSDWIDGTREA